MHSFINQEVSKILGAEWKSMSARQKKPYETQAKRDKVRHSLTRAHQNLMSHVH